MPVPYWYKGPGLERRPLRNVMTWAVRFYNDLGEIPYDVNGDGWTDLISGGWFTNDVWYENQRGEEKLWPERKIVDSEGTEGLIFEDLTGDGVPEIIPTITGRRRFSGSRSWPGRRSSHAVGKQGSRHGLGVGDVDRDGRKDIVTMDGWYKAPEDPRSGQWVFQPDWKNEGAGGIRMLVHDVNSDGLNDIIYGMGHDYGLFSLAEPGSASSSGIPSRSAGRRPIHWPWRM